MLASGRFCPVCGLEQPRREPARDPYVGRVIADRYEVGELINVGGMGRVHRALQRSLDRDVAIKFIHPHLLSSADAVARFMTEARAASRLRHPNVVGVFDFGRTESPDGLDLYIVMELLSGSDLGRVVAREAPLSLERVLPIVRQVLSALGAAHRQGITHRDVKPENVIIDDVGGDDEHVKVIDFGIASVTGASRITSAGQVIGTPLYMAPEQARGAAIGPRTDVYATGVMLFELLTGRPPFESASAADVLRQHATAPRPDPRAFAPAGAIPDALATLCLRAMQIEPADRFGDANEMSRALQSVRIPTRTAPLRRETPTRGVDARMAVAETKPATPVDVRTPRALLGRGAQQERLVRALATADASLGVALRGATGVGKTALSDSVCEALGQLGWFVARIETERAPRCEIGFGAARALLQTLRGAASSEAEDELADALASAIATAASGAQARRVLLAVDDADRMDAPSRAAVAAALRCTSPMLARALVTGVAPLDEWTGAGLAHETLLGLDAAAAAEWLSANGVRRSLPRGRTHFEPLYLERLCRDVDRCSAETLEGVVRAQFARRSRVEHRTLAALAICGRASISALESIVEGVPSVRTIVTSLANDGWIARGHEQLWLAHDEFAVAARESLTPEDARIFHARCAKLETAVELRAHHAIRSEPDLGAFVAAEEAAALRERRGDVDGALAMLGAAFQAAHRLVGRGEIEDATEALAHFGAKLATRLERSGRIGEARAVLLEAMRGIDPTSEHHARIGVQIAQLDALRSAHPATSREAHVLSGSKTSDPSAASA